MNCGRGRSRSKRERREGLGLEKEADELKRVAVGKGDREDAKDYL